VKASFVIRAAMTAFILVLFAIAFLGWTWTGANQTPAQAMASRAVLGLSVAAGVAGLVALWRGSKA
jgi:hypothetical protein